MSWVFLTEAFAYKVKKPIRSEYADYTAIAARERACQRELELNRPLAPSVYLDVIPVVDVGGALRVGGHGRPLEWLLKMRRLPRERMLDAMLARGVVAQTHAEQIARALAPFYRAVERACLTGEAYQARLVEDVEAKRRSLSTARYRLPSELVNGACDRLRRWLDAETALVQARAGEVVDAHGDLRPQHICLELPPSIIDRLDFSADLRLLDPLSELAFLALECRRLGAPELGASILEAYQRRSPAAAPAALIDAYSAYHACVRAAVAIWHLDDHAIDADDAWRATAVQYLRAARELAPA